MRARFQLWSIREALEKPQAVGESKPSRRPSPALLYLPLQIGHQPITKAESVSGDDIIARLCPSDSSGGSLSAADLHVVVMGDQYVGIVHPCKIYNVLAVRKPFLYIGPNESHVTDIVGQSSAYVSSHGDVEGVVANILSAMGNTVPGLPRGVEVDALFSKSRLVPQMISAIEQGGRANM